MFSQNMFLSIISSISFVITKTTKIKPVTRLETKTMHVGALRCNLCAQHLCSEYGSLCSSPHSTAPGRSKVEQGLARVKFKPLADAVVTNSTLSDSLNV